MLLPLVSFYRHLNANNQKYSHIEYTDCLAGIDKWTCKERCTGSTAGTVIVKRFDDLLYNTAGFIGYNTRRKHIIVSFKGSASIRNFITDLKLYKVDAQYKLDRLKVPSGAKIHGGFAEGYNAARKQIRQTVKQILDGPGKGFEVHVTGHSLGGALAILGGIDMFDFLGDAYKNRIRVYAYGEPRVGNKAWADWVYTLPFYERMYRVTGKSDIVTLIPPTWMDFRHHRAEYWIKGGKTTQCDDSLGEAAACAASAIIPSILDHITGYFDIPFGPWC
ncbi:Alpha/Beta hydrolase protein [Phlyctochytrium arcticum]|nr:Alpha/Beta hydrolase protein [Phlyctochytrium arcticum]